MKKFFRKFLIYLIAIGMLCPAWLATGVLKATHAKAANVPNFESFDLILDGDKTVSGSYKNGFVLNSSDLGSGPAMHELDIANAKLDDYTATTGLAPDGETRLYNFVSVSNDTNLAKYFEGKDGLLTSDAEYLQGVAEGSKTAFLLEVTDTAGDESYELLDGFSYYQYNNLTPLKIDDTYPSGYYAYFGQVTTSDGSNNFITVQLKIDTENPVITLNGEATVNVEEGSQYEDLGATAHDNLDGDTTSKIVVVNNVNTAITGDGYTVTYNVTDAAGNPAVQVTRTVNVVAKVAPIVSPDFTVTYLSGKTFRVEWTGNGADSYIIKVNGNADPAGAVLKTDPEVYSRDITVSGYGTYEISLIAMNGNVPSTNFQTHPIILNAPAVTVAATPARAAEETPVVIAGPTSAQVAPPVENKVETPVDDSAGQIKGDETKDNENEKTNWTPWIVLFVLILLAGAATGGYFYWFNGEDEVKAAAPVAVTKDVKKGDDAVKTTVRSKNGHGKQKRW